MSDEAARAARMYPSMVAKPSSTESTEPVRNPGQSDGAPSATGAMTGSPSGDAAFKQSHPHDMAARRYPNMAQPDPVAQKIADEIKGEKPTELVEQVPEHIAKLRESDPLRYPASYDVAIGVRTSDVLNGRLSPEVALTRNFVAGVAHDMGLNPGELTTIVNQVRAAKAGKTSTETVDDADKADAFALIGRDMRVSNLVDALGITNDPVSLRIFARAARAERTKGRLT